MGRVAVSAPSAGTLLVFLGGTAALLTFFSPKTGLGILVFSMLLSPEIGLGRTGYRDVVIRYDDILVLVVFFSWLARSAIKKETAFFFSTPVNLPIFLYITVCVLSTSLGIVSGRLHFAESFFYVLKYIEYFMLFLLAANIIENEKNIRAYLICGAITAAVVIAYGATQYFILGGGFRVALPFESPMGQKSWGEPATAGGYYLIVMAVLLGFYTQVKGRVSKLSIISFVLIAPLFMLTLSRTSYLAFAAMTVSAIVMTGRKKIHLAAVILCMTIGIAVVSPVIKDTIQERVLFTFQTKERVRVTFHVGPGAEIKLESSAAARVLAWQRIFFEKFPIHPLLGWGVPGVGIVDSQIPLVLGETGLLGLSLFLWMLLRIWKTGAGLYRNPGNDTDKALGFALCILLIALFVQTLGVNTFIIVRVMEPFWLLAAIVARRYAASIPVVPADNPEKFKEEAGMLQGRRQKLFPAQP
ncbi:MAG: O-antigen ligase family protein [bacterium]